MARDQGGRLAQGQTRIEGQDGEPVLRQTASKGKMPAQDQGGALVPCRAASIGKGRGSRQRQIPQPGKGVLRHGMLRQSKKSSTPFPLYLDACSLRSLLQVASASYACLSPRRKQPNSNRNRLPQQTKAQAPASKRTTRAQVRKRRTLRQSKKKSRQKRRSLRNKRLCPRP